MEQGTRRGFLAGLGALVLAPAIVPLYQPALIIEAPRTFTRFLCDYDIGGDCMRLRGDIATTELVIPYNVDVVPEEVALRFLPRERFLALVPKPGQQLYMGVMVEGREFVNAMCQVARDNAVLRAGRFSVNERHLSRQLGEQLSCAA